MPINVVVATSQERLVGGWFYGVKYTHTDIQGKERHVSTYLLALDTKPPAMKIKQPESNLTMYLNNFI